MTDEITFSTNLSARASGARGPFAKGAPLVYDTSAGEYVLSTAANRATANARTQAFALGAVGSNVLLGSVGVREAGMLPAALSGIGAGTANQLVRVTDAGTLERIASYTDGDDVVGFAEADGRVHLHIGLPWEIIYALAQGTFLNPATGGITRVISNWLLEQAFNIKDFGASTGSSDNSTAIQAAINAAASGRGLVQVPVGVYAYATGLTIPAGVMLVGMGRGSSPLATPNAGSALSYTGSGTAIKLQGYLSGLQNISVCGTASAAEGVTLDGDARTLESCVLKHILIYGFTGGKALYLNGRNNGYVAYCLFEDIRIRYAKTNIHIYDANSLGGSDHGFVNTNQFVGGAISSGAGVVDYGIRIQGGNDNRFFGMSVEPYTSTYGHIVVERGELKFDGRLEGAQQPVTTPLVDISAGAEGFIDGLGGSGLIKNASTRFTIPMVSGKHAEPRRSPRNLFDNASFAGADATAHTIPGWTVTETGSATTWTIQAEEIADRHAVIQVSVPAGATFELKPSPAPTKYNSVDTATFGFWIKTSIASKAYARINSSAGVTTSVFHSGGGTWEPVSMFQYLNTVAAPDPRFVFDNSAGAVAATFYLTAPYFAFGRINPENVAALPTAGGIMRGAIEGGGLTATLPSSGDNTFYTSASSGILTVPKAANVVHVAGSPRIISRFNSATNRFAANTLVRVVFDIAGVTVSSSVYITLLSGSFVSTVGSSLLLEADGAGTWTERSRSGGTSLDDVGATITLPSSGDSAEYTTATSELTVPSFATIHVAGTARTIARLNNLANRFPKYAMVRIVFDIASVSVTNGAYIGLDSSFTSTVGGWLLLEHTGSGVWAERDRK